MSDTGHSGRARLLLVDDDEALREALTYSLEREGFVLETVEDGEAALEAARESDFDLLLLNVMLPRLYGTDVCRTLRAESDVPIIFLSARDSEQDRVLGLELGADDYITKPFSMIELVSRIRSLLRRRELDHSGAGGIRHVGDVRLDPLRHQVTVSGATVRLTRSEFRLLTLLSEEPERVYSRCEIIQHLWDSEFVGNERAADIHISNLRRKIERDPHNPERLVTVRGVGYSFVPSAAADA